MGDVRVSPEALVVAAVLALGTCGGDGGPAATGGRETSKSTTGTGQVTTTTAAPPARVGTVSYSENGDVWLFDGTTGEKRQLTTDGETRLDRAPRFVSSEVVSYLSGQEHVVLRTIDLASGTTRDVAEGPIDRYAWSPDRRQVVTLEQVGERESALKIRDVDHPNQTELRRFAHPNELDRGTFEGLDELSLAWAPGSAILFVDTSLSYMSPDDDAATLFLLRPDGTPVMAPVPRATFGRWSVDGRQVYYLARHWHVFDMTSGAVRRLPFGFGPFPTLSPDGEKIAYHGDGAEPPVWIADLRTGAQREVTRGAIHPVWLDNDNLIMTNTVRCPRSPQECEAGGHGSLWDTANTTSRLDLRTGAREPLPLSSTEDIDVVR